MKKGVFKINPHVIKQLGSELVSDSVTAIMELIKNSYDADADYVKVTINTKESLVDDSLFYPREGGYILIEDDGIGMNEAIIRDSWLTISYSSKRAVNGVKPKTVKQRTPLGDKGLGRLSTQRLAEVCEIFSKTETDDYIHAGFEWASFDRVKDLTGVEVKMSNDPFNKQKGTKLVLLGLTDKYSWFGENLERFKAQISQLISPYQEKKPFKVALYIDNERVDIEGDFKKLDEVCVSDISFSYNAMQANISMNIHLQKLRGNSQNTDNYSKYIVADNGEAFLGYLLNQKKASYFKRGSNGCFLHFSDSIDSIYFNKNSLFETGFFDPGSFQGRIREFALNTENDSWSRLYSSFDSYKSFVQNQIGIKLYRNGFAIKPYGIDGQDWLSLSKGQTSGGSFYGLRPGNVIGYVAIKEDVNVHLKDKTDREGLIDNEYYRSFYGILEEIIHRVNEAMQILRRAYVNYIKERKADKDNGIHSYDQAIAVVQDALSRENALIEGFKTATKESSSLIQQVNEIKGLEGGLFDLSIQQKDTLQFTIDALNRYNNLLLDALSILELSPAIKESVDFIIPEVDQLRNQMTDVLSLASLGLVSEFVSHDLGLVTTRLLEESKRLAVKISKTEIIEKRDVLLLIEYIKSTVSSIRSQIKHLDSSFKYNKELKETIVISDFIIDEEKSFFKVKVDEYGLAITVKIKNDFSVIINRGKLTQVFDNLINNSIYWLNKCKSQGNTSDLSMTITIDKPFVYFEDNGWGVANTIEDSIFEPFVTRKPKGEGRGLGLYIVKHLLGLDHCEIFLSEKRNHLNQRYEFVINFQSTLES